MQFSENSIFSAILNNDVLILAITDENGILINMSKGFCDLSGYKKIDLIEKSFSFLCTEKIIAIEKVAAFPVVAEDVKKEWVLQKKDGSLINIHSSSESVLQQDGSCLTIIFIEESYLAKNSGKTPYPDAVKYQAFVNRGICDITKKTETEQQLIINEKRYRALIENGADAVVILTTEGKPLYVSPSFEKVLGYTEKEAMQLNLFSMTHPDDLEEEGKVWEQVLANPGVPIKGFTSRILHKDGSWRWMEDTVTNMLHDPSVKGIIDNFRDVTEKINAQNLREFERRDKEALINTTEDLIWSVDNKFKLIAANKAFVKDLNTITGITIKQGDDLLMDQVFSKDYLLLWESCYKKCLSGESYKKEIYTPAINERKEMWTETSFNPMYKDNAIIAIACYSRNITEKKLAEEKIKQSEMRLAEAQAIAKLGSWETNLLTWEVIWSKETFRIFGLDPGNFNTSHPAFLEYVHPDDREKVDAAFLASLSKNADNKIIHRIVTPDGLVKIVEECWMIFRDEEGVPIRAVGTCQDITERKNAEEKIKESELKFRAFFENSLDGIVLAVADGEILAANPAACDMFRMTEEEICAAGRFGMVDISEPRLMNLIKERQLTGKAKGEITYLRKDGSKFPGEISSVEFMDSKGEKRTSMIIRDITDRKLSEEKIENTSIELKQALNDLTKIMDSSLDVICAVDANGYFIKVSAASEAVWGYKPEELIGKPLINFVYHEDNEKTQVTAGNVMAGKHVNHFENRYIRKDGTLVSIEWTARWDEKDKIRYGVARNVTEKKLLEKAFETERRRLYDLLTHAPTSIGALRGPNHIFELANPLCLELIGKKDIIGKPIIEVVPELIDQGYIKILDRVYETGETFSANEMLVKLDRSGNGELVDKYLNFIYQAYRDIDNKIEGIFFFIIDVTEQVISRKKIEESEKQYRRIVDTAEEGIWLIDERDVTTFVNNKMCEILEYSREEMLGEKIFTFMDDEGKNIAAIGIQNRKDGHSGKSKFKYVSKSGKDVWTYISTNPLFSDDGNYNGALAMVTDITENKKAKEDIRKSEEQRTLIMNAALDAIVCMDAKGMITFWNSQAEIIFGWNEKEVMGKSLSGFIIPEQYRMQHEHGLAHYLKTGKGPALNILLELSAVKRNGDTFPIELTILPIGEYEEKFFCAFIRDITERKRAELKIKEAYHEKNTILESIDDGFFAIDNNSKVLYWNKKAEVLLNVKKEDIIGNNLHEMFANPDSITFYNQYQKAIKENSTLHFEEFSKRTKKWFAVSAFPSGNGLSVYFKDVTERKTAEEAVRLSNERYNMVSKATNDSIWDWDFFTDKMIRTGDGFNTLFGYDNNGEEMDHLAWEKLVHPYDLERIQNSLLVLFENPLEFYWEDEYRFLKANGQYAWVYDKGYLTRDENGKVSRMIGATQDITQQIEHVNEITRIQHNLDSLINTTTDMIWSIDSEMKIIAANKAYSESIKKVTKKPVEEGDAVILQEFGLELMNKWEGYYIRALRGELFSVEESTWHPEKGETLHTIISFCPIINIPDLVSGVACYAKDVTELKKSGKMLQELNRELNDRAEELAASNTELERFAYIASHDLQEPLRMVSSFLQLLEKKYNHQLDETAHKYIHFAVDGANRMKKLIQDLLEYSRAGSVEDLVGKTDMNEVMQEVLMNLNASIEDSGAEIKMEILPVLHNTRQIQMLQLMQNLVSNALKYRGNEKPVISIAAQEEEQQWIFSVKDNGIGIEPRFADKIFNIFQRLHNKSEFSGTGIGLSICKKIVERHGGKIWVEPNEWKGTVFYFSISKLNINF